MLRQLRPDLSRRIKLGRGLLILLSIVFVRLYLLSDEEHRRRLKCTTFTDRSLRQSSESEEVEPCSVEYPITEESYSTYTDDYPNFAIAGGDGTAIEGGNHTVMDEYERTLTASFEPDRIYDSISAEERATSATENSIAYVTALEGCPELYETNEHSIFDPDSYLYEASAVTKTCICELTDNARTSRRLGSNRKLQSSNIPAAEMNYTMIAMIHPQAVECHITGSHGETFDRVKLLQSEGYRVEILGHPITEPDLLTTNPYIANNIQDTIGIRDSMKLNAWTFTDHPVVVLVGYDFMLTKPLDQEIDELLADVNRKGMYVSQPPLEGNCVDTQFMIIKPSMEEFSNIVAAYQNTPYVPSTGWNGQGHHGCKGEMGLNGFLSYYFANNPGYTELDRCTYAHTAGEACLSQVPLGDAKNIKIIGGICGDPRSCPQSDPNWSEEQRLACEKLHRTYMMFRYDFETKYFNKTIKSLRTGFFKSESFLGYCDGAGSSGYESMTGKIKPKPDWQIVCPPIICAEGQYMKNDCTCTDPSEDPCVACPFGTYCQREPFMCLDCECGFCDNTGTACCSFNGQNNCKTGLGNSNLCIMQNNFFAAFEGTGNVCGGVEISMTAVPNGCGCKPNAESPCTYNPDWDTGDSCFVCTALDLAIGKCPSCVQCLSHCSSCILSANTQQNVESCLKSMKSPECRASCHQSCLTI